jgi:hypothetical protein
MKIPKIGPTSTGCTGPTGALLSCGAQPPGPQVNITPRLTNEGTIRTCSCGFDETLLGGMIKAGSGSFGSPDDPEVEVPWVVDARPYPAQPVDHEWTEE